MNTKTTDLIDSQAAEITARGFIIERQEKRIAELELLTTWRPIETAPKDGTEILLYIPVEWKDNQPILGSYYFTEKEIWQSITGNWLTKDRPTHWMPRPPLSTDQQGE